MAFAANVWNQLKGITAGELASALERDGWEKDTRGGSAWIYRKAPNRRASVHMHPQKTFGPALLKGLLVDIGWSEADMKRLKLIK